MSFVDDINDGLGDLGYSHRWHPSDTHRVKRPAKRHMVLPRADAEWTLEHREVQAARGLEDWEDTTIPTDERVASWHAEMTLRRHRMRPDISDLEAAERRDRHHARSALGKVGSRVSPPVVDDPHYPVVLRPSGWRPEELVPSTPAWRACPRVLRPEWVPEGVPASVLEARRLAWRLRRALRPIARRTSECGQHSRIAACGVLPTAAGGVSVMVSPETGRASYKGLQHCSSVWECPVCRAKIAAGRCDEIRAVVEDYWAPERCGMFTATIAHTEGMSLRELRRGLAHAWRLMAQGKTWVRFKASTGLHGGIRALEVTHGPHGWHPHLHGVWLFEAAQAWDEQDRWRDELHAVMQRRWADCVSHAFESLGEREARSWDERPYASHVAAYHRARGERLGRRCRPKEGPVGFVVKRCLKATYLAKLGLELSDPGSKKARAGHETPTDIAYRWAESKDADAAELWQEYCAAMKGSRHLTWTRGLKEAARVAERSDAEVAADEDAPASVVEVGTIALEDWKKIRALVTTDPRAPGRPASLWILEQVERHGADRLARAVQVAVRRAG